MKKHDFGPLNPALAAQAVSFGPVLPYVQGETRIPLGLRYDGGAPLLTVYAPGASAVKAETDGWTGENALALQSAGDGLWSARLDAGPGFHYIQLWADGVPLLSPMLPIGYGYSRPYNYLDIAPLAEFCTLENVPHGALCHEYYFSEATGTMETCLVYTPPGYEDSARRYPVLYLQHGHGENETGWAWQGKINFILDNLLARGEAAPMVVVMNNGMVRPQAQTAGAPADQSLFEKRLLEDVLPFIEKKYRVLADRDHRALAGLSMGSMQTSIIGFKHMDLFGWLGLFSGFMRNLFQPEDNAHLDALLENKEAFHADIRLFFRCMGRDDPFYPRFEADDRFCCENGIRCVRKLYDGGHDWNVWRSCAHDFLRLLFQ